MLPDDTSSEYLTHKDPSGTNITFSAAGWAVCQEGSYGIVPTASGGTSQSLNFVVHARP
jgi:hypothetical protein